MPLEYSDERFWSKVRIVDECWVWTSAQNARGYGAFTLYIDGKKVQRRAHRISYELVVGLIPAGLEIDHLCRNRLCINPAHLEPVTHAENLRRGERFNKTHCIRGHEFSFENTRIRIRNGRRERICRSCQNIAQKRFQANRQLV